MRALVAVLAVQVHVEHGRDQTLAPGEEQEVARADPQDEKRVLQVAPDGEVAPDIVGASQAAALAEAWSSSSWAQYAAPEPRSDPRKEEELQCRTRTCFQNAFGPREQEQVLRLIAAVDRALVAHGVQYTVAFGTLLGLARHGGRIPWDDDVDIMVPLDAKTHSVEPAGFAVGQCMPPELRNRFEPGKYRFTVTDGVQCTQVQIKGKLRRALESLEREGFGVHPVTEHSITGRQFVKVHYARETAINPMRDEAFSFPWVDVFLDSTEAHGGPCHNCWPVQRTAFDGIEVSASRDVLASLRDQYAGNVPNGKHQIAELFRTCWDRGRDHCRRGEAVCDPCSAPCSTFLNMEKISERLPGVLTTIRDYEREERNAWGATACVIGTIAMCLIFGFTDPRARRTAWRNKLGVLSLFLLCASQIFQDVMTSQVALLGGHKFPFQPATAALCAEVVKLVVNLLACGWDWETTKAVSREQLVKTGRLMFLPAMLFAFCNVLHIHALSEVDLSQYRVWRQSDILFTAFFWSVCFRTPLTWRKVCGVALVFAGCVLSCDTGAFAFHQGMVHILMIALCAALANVANEYGLKSDPALSLPVQNCLLYVWSSAAAACVLLATNDPFAGVATRGFCIVVACSVLVGTSVAMTLKYADAVLKVFTGACIGPLEVIFGHYSMLGTPLTAVVAISAILTSSGTAMYVYRPREPEKRVEKA